MILNKLNDWLYNTDHDDINHLIARFIKKNLNYISNMTIDEVATGCYVSKAKISNFCKVLGYKNFIEFKDDCAREVKNKKIVIDRQKENLDLEFKQHIYKSMHAIENNLCRIHQSDMDRLVENITKSSHIYLYGGAYSNLLCQYMQCECDILEKEVIVLDEKLKKEYMMSNESLLIVMSVEGHTLNNQRLLHKIKKYPVNKWLISTDVINIDLLNNFDYCLIIPSLGTEMKDRRILMRYAIDMIIGRHQYLHARGNM